MERLVVKNQIRDKLIEQLIEIGKFKSSDGKQLYELTTTELRVELSHHSDQYVS